MKYHILNGKGNIIASFNNSVARDKVLDTYFNYEYPGMVFNKKDGDIRDVEDVKEFNIELLFGGQRSINIRVLDNNVIDEIKERLENGEDVLTFFPDYEA